MGTEPEVVDEFFADLRYPGSKRLRRPAPEKQATSVSEKTWDRNPIHKKINGKDVELFFPNALAEALGKRPVTIRLWERRTYIPVAPFRLPGYTDARGVKHPGKRVYTRQMIEIAIEEFAARDLLGSARIEWKHHTDLTIALVERWSLAKNAI